MMKIKTKEIPAVVEHTLVLSNEELETVLDVFGCMDKPTFEKLTGSLKNYDALHHMYFAIREHWNNNL